MPRLPIQCLCAANDHTVLASGVHVSLVNSSGALIARSTPENGHSAFVRLLLVSKDGLTLVSVGDDKNLKVWDLPSLTLRSTRTVAKRATAVSFDADGQHIVLADKFGDVYRLPIEAPESSTATAKKELAPLLGHVSLLTGLYMTKDGQRIITADRDEHVRVSRYPESWDIIAYLGGHKRFVSALCSADDDQLLLSAGGDSELFVWDLAKYELKRKIDISALEQGVQIAMPRQEAMIKKFKYRQQKGKGKEKQVEAESEGVEEEAEAPVFSTLAVNKIAVVGEASAQTVLVTAAGSNRVLHFPLSALSATDAIMCDVFEASGPVLDVLQRKEDVLLSVDRSRLPDSEQPPSLCRVALNGGQVVVLGPVADESAFVEAGDKDVPDDETLYGELSYLTKDPAEAAGYREPQQREPAVEPAKKKVKT